MTTATANATARHVGRFELVRELGRGAQAQVWLAHDPRLDRDVALKLLDASAGADTLTQWLDEARAVSRLNHPNIVPVFEADRHAGQSYLVFEYVAGPTLADVLRRQQRAQPPHDAVALVLGVLAALAAAHAEGIVHRDLKPSNILIGVDGRPRVMDFGIAARTAQATAGTTAGRPAATNPRGGAAAVPSPAGPPGDIVGTPGYISPEAARGAAPLPAMDVFSAGVLLAELLTGAPLLRESDPRRALARVQTEDLVLPATAAVDDRLRSIVQQALARDTAARWDGAAAFHAALSAWLQPPAAASSEQPHAGVAAHGNGNGNGTLDFLLRRMRNKGDFPALSDSVVRIQKVATSETESVGSLSAEILKDVALTNKLLRMVNTAQFGSAAGGGVSTVSRAVALIGFAGIRNMALSLVLLEHMRDKSHAAQLKEEFVRCLLAGTLADALTPQQREGEEAFLGTIFQSLGRLLTEYYFPEEALQIRQSLPAPDAAGGIDAAAAVSAAREAAAVRVLGIGFDELGLGIARSWGLPDALQRCMRPPRGDAPARAVERGGERQRWAGRVSTELADALLHLQGDALRRQLSAIGKRYSAALDMPAKDIVAAVQSARERLALLAPAMGLQAAPGTAARRLLDATPAASTVTDSLAPHQLQPTLALAAAANEATLVLPADGGGRVAAAPPPAARLPMADMLAAGIQDITNTMVADDFRLNEVLRMVLETMIRALDFQRVVFCLRDPKTDTLTGRFGLGHAADTVSRAFKVPLRVAAGADLFAAVCAKGVDTVIKDAGAANIAARLPGWYRSTVQAPAFLLLPMVTRGTTFALIYADKATAGSIDVGEKELSLLRTLRNQAVMAFRQSGG